MHTKSVYFSEQKDGYVCTVYQETLTKGKFDEFEESWLNHQTKTIQYKATIYF